MIEIRRILCPVDFSDSSLQAWKYAISMAKEAGARLTILHVVEHELRKTAESCGPSHDSGMTIEEFLAQREEALRAHLRDAAAEGRECCTVEAQMAYGKPWRKILHSAAEEECDVIVMGVHGRGVADLLFFGSTTQHVVRQARCPVLTLRSG